MTGRDRAEPPPTAPQQSRIFIVAGEPSGDVIGAEIMAALIAQSPKPITFAGIGGPRMAALGLKSEVAIDALSVFGAFELIPQLWRIRQILQQTLTAIAGFQPDIVLTVDSKGFSFALAKRLAARRGSALVPRLMHVVAPTVWAYRPERARKIAAFLDHLLVLFPFEPGYFTIHGLLTNFIGHPAADRQLGNGKRFRASHDFAPDVPILGLFPGSRRSEVQRLLPDFLAAAKILSARYERLKIVLPTVSAVMDHVQHAVQASDLDITVLPDVDDKSDLFAGIDLALAASGTVTLELALAAVPSVVAYRLHPLSALIALRIVDLSAVVLSNRILGRAVQPVFLQKHCTPDNLASALKTFLEAPGAATQAAAIAAELRQLLRQGDPELHGTAAAAAANFVLAELAGGNALRT